MRVVPVSLKDANAFVEAHHRHHRASQGHKFSLGVVAEGRLAGVCIVGRPVARLLDDGWTLEVTRLCVIEDARNACSMLYGAAARAAKAMGYARIGTYIREDEPGASLRGAGWRQARTTGASSWERQNRQRTDKTVVLPRSYWTLDLAEPVEYETPAPAVEPDLFAA